MILLATVMPFLFIGCGVYSVSSGYADKAAICFVSTNTYDISVNVDNDSYDVTTIKQKSYKRNRDIKKTANNHIALEPGRHKVIVIKDNKEIYNGEVFVSATETKIVEL